MLINLTELVYIYAIRGFFLIGGDMPKIGSNIFEGSKNHRVVIRKLVKFFSLRY